MIKELENINFK